MKELSIGDDTTTFEEMIDLFNQASVDESKPGELTSIILNPLINLSVKYLSQPKHGSWAVAYARG